MLRIAGRIFARRASRSSCSLAFNPSVYCRELGLSGVSKRDEKTYFLPSSFFLCKRIQCLVQRVCYDGTHCLVPCPGRVNTGLTQQIHEGFLALFESRKAVMRNGRLIGEVGTCRKCRRRWLVEVWGCLIDGLLGEAVRA
jgi:hypothetical protein